MFLNSRKPCMHRVFVDSEVSKNSEKKAEKKTIYLLTF